MLVRLWHTLYACKISLSHRGSVVMSRRHHLYVMIRVLRLAQDDPLVWQKALLRSEAEEARHPPCPAPV